MRYVRPVQFAITFSVWCALMGAARSEEIKATLLQLNDVYEITPLDRESVGKLARVASLRNDLREKNPNTFMLIAGDFVSPSALGNAFYEGEPLKGRQMVSVLNAIGLDYATFGNHEFDITRDQLLRRIRESTFKWTSTNVTDALGDPFEGVPRHLVLNIPGKRGGTFRIAIIGLTIDSNKDADYVRYHKAVDSARAEAEVLSERYDALIALTHLAIAEDKILAKEVEAIDLILGGHEHEHSYNQVMTSRHITPIVKADANARTVYVHQLQYDTESRHLRIESTLTPIVETPENKDESDGRTRKLAKYWKDEAFENLTSLVKIAPDQKAFDTEVPLEGREACVRTQRTNLTAMIVQSLREAVPGADLAMINSGSIRIDDVIPPGEVLGYDFLRILPYPGRIFAVNMRGSLLKEILTRGEQLAPDKEGGFLQVANVSHAPDGVSWRIGDAALDPGTTYKVALTDYLLDGREKSFGTTEKFAKDLNAELKTLRATTVSNMPVDTADLHQTVLAYLIRHAPFKDDFLATLKIPPSNSDCARSVQSLSPRDLEPQVVSFLIAPTSATEVKENGWFSFLGRISNFTGALIFIGSILTVQMIGWMVRWIRTTIHQQRELERELDEADKLLQRFEPSSAAPVGLASLAQMLRARLSTWPALRWFSRHFHWFSRHFKRTKTWRDELLEIAKHAGLGKKRVDLQHLVGLITTVSARAAILQAWLNLEQSLLKNAGNEPPYLDRIINKLSASNVLTVDTVGAIQRLQRLRDQANNFHFTPSRHHAMMFIQLVLLVLVDLQVGEESPQIRDEAIQGAAGQEPP